MEDKVYAFQYTDCIDESAFATMSLHKSCKGAYNAMIKYILKGYNDWRNDGIELGKQTFKYGSFENWRVVVIDINE